MKRLHRVIFGATVFKLVLATCAAPADPLANRFQHPPASAKPHTWWHRMNGHITKEGITADIEGMKRVAIGGAQAFHVSNRIRAEIRDK